MSANHLIFEPVTLSPGWRAQEAWAPGGPIVLVDAQSAQGEVSRSRFDVHKAMFIDPLPFQATQEGARRLAASVTSASHF